MNAAESKTLMTSGPIWKKIIMFALPLFLGTLFQQLYNTADSLIVGNFLDSNALAAVSSSGNLIFLMVGFFNGIAMGAGVVIARYYGARNTENLQKAIHTTISLGLAASAVPPRFLSGWERQRMCCPSPLHISAFTLQVPWDLLCIMYLWAYCSL